MSDCTVYVMDISYFSGKFEAYLRYKEIPYRRVDVSHRQLYEVYLRTGTMKVPAVELPDGRWLKDTTPMIRWFEEQHQAHPVIPSDPVLRFIANLIEDYADEWLWRPAMWWRWMPRGSRVNLGRRIADEILGDFPGPAFLKAIYFGWRQRRTWLWGDGMTRDNSAQIRDMYPQQLAALEQIFSERPFLFGEQPGIADYGYFASMFRHFGNDPDSSIVMRQTAPGVHAWLARMWNARASAFSEPPQWSLPEGEGMNFILRDICSVYLPYLHQNACAFRDGQRRFDFSAGGLQLPGTHTTDYRVWCRQDLQRQLAGLSDADRDRVVALLQPHGGVAALLADGEIDSGLDDELKIPFKARPPASAWHRARVWLFGNPRQARA